MNPRESVPRAAPESVLPVLVVTCSVALLLALALGLGACSSSSGPSGSDDGDDDDGPGCIVFVDASYSGDEIGTQEEPFNTIEEGIAAADSGCTVRLASGTYVTSRSRVVLPHLMRVVGAGMDASRVGATFELGMFTPPEPVRICSLSCENVVFGINPDTTSYSYAPVTISDCHIDALVETLRLVGPSAPFRLIRCEVDGDIDMAERECHSARTVSGCDVGGDVVLWQVQGDTSAVLNSTVAGDLSLWAVAVDRQTASGNAVGGGVKLWAVSVETQEIVDNVVSGDSLYAWSLASDRTRINANTVTQARVELTGSSAADVEIDDNDVSAGGILVIARAIYGSLRGNSVSVGRSGETGIKVRSRSAALDVEDNTVTLPYSPPSGTPAAEDTLAPAGIRALSTSGPWVRGNDVSGGAYGIYCKSISAGVSGNTVTGAHTGIYARATSCSLGNNVVTGCVGDGFLLSAAPETLGAIAVYRMAGNVSSDNGGAGVRANSYTLLKSGPGRDGNTLTGNADYDLVVETLAADVETLPASGNYWDHGTVEDVNEFDVWDGKDDPSLTTVILSPLGSGGGAW